MKVMAENNLANEQMTLLQIKIRGLRRPDGWPSPGDVDQDKVRDIYRHVPKETGSSEILQADLKCLCVDAKLAEALLMVFKSESEREKFLASNEPTSFRSAADEAWKNFVDRVVETIKANDLDQEEGAGRKGELFRSLCALAWDWGVDPETFRQLLVGAGLAGSRASEIKRVLSSKACKRFLSKQNPISWKDALEESRAEDFTGLELAARELIRLLVAHQNKWEKESDLKDFKVRAGRSGDYTLRDNKEGTLTLVLRTNHSARLQPAAGASTTKA